MYTVYTLTCSSQFHGSWIIPSNHYIYHEFKIVITWDCFTLICGIIPEYVILTKKGLFLYINIKSSMVTLETLEKSLSVLNEYAPLAQAVQPAAIPSIRHGATSGGTLYLDTRCIYYKKCSKHSNRNRPIIWRNI